MACNNSKLDLAKMNAYINLVKFYQLVQLVPNWLSICYQDIERKRNFGVNKGHNSGTNV